MTTEFGRLKQNLSLLLFFLFVLPANQLLKSQDTLVCFDKPFPKETPIGKYPDFFLGEYADNEGVRWEISNKSIETLNYVFIALTKEEVENSELIIRNDYVHGFVEGDSLPFIEKSDTLFFAYPHKKPIFKINEETTSVILLENTLFIFQSLGEKEGYNISKISLEGSSLVVSYQDNEKILSDMNFFKKWKLLDNNSILVIKMNKKTQELLLNDDYYERALELFFVKEN